MISLLFSFCRDEVKTFSLGRAKCVLLLLVLSCAYYHKVFFKIYFGFIEITSFLDLQNLAVVKEPARWYLVLPLIYQPLMLPPSRFVNPVSVDEIISSKYELVLVKVCLKCCLKYWHTAVHFAAISPVCCSLDNETKQAFRIKLGIV